MIDNFQQISPVRYHFIQLQTFYYQKMVDFGTAALNQNGSLLYFFSLRHAVPEKIWKELRKAEPIAKQLLQRTE